MSDAAEIGNEMRLSVGDGTRRAAEGAGTRVLLVDRRIAGPVRDGVGEAISGSAGWCGVEVAIGEADPESGRSIPEGAAIVFAGVDGETIDRARRLGIPAVNVLDSGLPGRTPLVACDNFAAAEAAFAHFASLGLKHLGYLPWHIAPDDELRFRGFHAAAERAGTGQSVLMVTCALGETAWAQDLARQAAILLELPRPIGILAYSDRLGAMLLRAAAVAGLIVPAEIAVLAFDEHERFAKLTEPKLSTIGLSGRRVGYEAARLAMRLSEGESAGEAVQLVPQGGVVERGSTQMLIVADEDVNAALRFIRRRMAEGHRPSAPEVATAVLVSRRGLDGKFMRHLGRTVSDEVERLRLAETLHLLGTTELSGAEIARRTGFSSEAHLSRHVRKSTGKPPRAYRQWVRPGSASDGT